MRLIRSGGLSLRSPGLALCPVIPSSLLPPPSSSQADSGRCWKPGFLKENDRFSFSAVGSVHRLSPSPWHCWLRSRCPRQAQSELTQLARSLLALLTTNVSLYLFTTAPFLLSNPRTYHLQPPPPKSLLSASAPLPHTHTHTPRSFGKDLGSFEGPLGEGLRQEFWKLHPQPPQPLPGAQGLRNNQEEGC